MQIIVRLFATYRSLVGERQLDLDVPVDTSVLAAIENLMEKYPHLRPHWFNQAGEIMPHLFVILNKQDVTSLPDGLNTKLKEGDELDFVPPVGGG
ncbi:MAG TPA: ubiquitin-like small modifier protein 1 [Anaerolineaceae bacterium]|nr:ubiquitin-like small modifier protein 1 [Anaerolineaceae bacterium]